MKTYIQLHGILAREYDGHFEYELGNPKNVLQAIDTNRKGFINRIIELEKQGFCYDIIINKKRVIHPEEMEQFRNPETIDLVPAITGSGVVATVVGSIVSFLGTSGLVATLVKAVIFAAVAYALTPTPEPEPQTTEYTLTVSCPKAGDDVVSDGSYWGHITGTTYINLVTYYWVWTKP